MRPIDVGAFRLEYPRSYLEEGRDISIEISRCYQCFRLKYTFCTGCDIRAVGATMWCFAHFTLGTEFSKHCNTPWNATGGAPFAVSAVQRFSGILLEPINFLLGIINFVIDWESLLPVMHFDVLMKVKVTSFVTTAEAYDEQKGFLLFFFQVGVQFLLHCVL